MTPPVLISLAYTRCSTLELGDSPASVDLLLSPIFRGVKGEPGDAGPGAGPILTLQGTAAAAVGGHQVVGLDDSGRYRYASNAVRGDAFRVAGISTGAAASGGALSVQTAGPLVEPSWTWIPDLPVFVGAGGALTQVVPTLLTGAAFVMVLGLALTSTSISIRLNPPLFL